MEFDYKYFEDEIIEGYPVTTMIKRGWAASLEVLKKVDEICKRNGIQYFAEWGTLLGAVRHKGFIPWDDDIDIAMRREDYNRFMQIAERELPKGYTVNSVRNKDHHQNCLCSILNTEVYDNSEEFLREYHGCPGAVGLDIVVLDYIPRDKKEREQLAEALDFLVSLRAQYDSLTREERREQIRLVEKTFRTKLEENKKVPVQFQLGILLENICSSYAKEESDELANLLQWQRDKAYAEAKERFEKTVELQFEMLSIPAPVGYEEHLKLQYGDYHQIVKAGEAHIYPHFEKDYMSGYRAIGGVEYLPDQMFMTRDYNPTEDRELILFIATQARRWDEMKPFYEKLVQEKADHADIYVMPIPYYRKDELGNYVEENYEGNSFPTDLPLVDYEEYNLAAIRPDMIYYQDSWDAWGEVLEVPQAYWSTELWACTNKLVLVPQNQPEQFGESDKKALKMLNFMCRYPGFIFSDNIMVAEELKKNYVDALCLFTGEETRFVWEKKLEV